MAEAMLKEPTARVPWPAAGPDLVSEVMSAIELAGSVQVRAEVSGAWGVHWEGGSPAMFHLMERGEGWILIRDQPPMRMDQGDVVLLKSGVDHDVVCAPGVRPKTSASPSMQPLAHRVTYQFGRDAPEAILICGAFHFRSPVEHPLVGMLPLVLRLPAGAAPHAQATAALIRELAVEAGEGRPGGDLMVRRLSDVLFIQLLRAGLALQHVPGGWLAVTADTELGAALRALHADPMHRWSVGELAERAAMSRAAFAARFTARAGEPPMQYLARWRVLLAARALRESDLTVDQIGATVGYRSKASFIRVFRRWTGQSPTGYRRGARDQIT
jgi:AraC-like DNA-binding protein